MSNVGGSGNDAAGGTPGTSNSHSTQPAPSILDLLRLLVTQGILLAGAVTGCPVPHSPQLPVDVTGLLSITVSQLAGGIDPQAEKEPRDFNPARRCSCIRIRVTSPRPRCIYSLFHRSNLRRVQAIWSAIDHNGFV